MLDFKLEDDINVFLSSLLLVMLCIASVEMQNKAVGLTLPGERLGKRYR